MDENPIHKTVKDIPKEGDTVQLENVKFPRSWSFWESYLAKGKKLNYTDSMKAIYEWDNLIAFWQFWNSYPFNRILGKPRKISRIKQTALFTLQKNTGCSRNMPCRIHGKL